MRKLREAAVVAAMVGGVSMFGAGAAFAGGHEVAPVACNQDAGDNTAAPQTGGLANIAGPVASGGAADSSATQQLCGIDNENAENTAGTSTGGAGGTLGLTL
jgi:hypothetical protein